MKFLFIRPSDPDVRPSARRLLTAVAAVLAVAIVGLLTIPRIGNGDQAYASSYPGLRPGALVLTMFSVETQPWLDNEKLTRTVAVHGMTEPLRCDARGELCVATLGEGKTNVATSVVSMLNDHDLDLTRTTFITSGIAGISPNRGTLGDATLADYAVDWDLCNHVTRETDPTVPFGYLKCDSYGTNEFRINPGLLQEAYSLTKNVKLADSAAAAQARARYPQQHGKKPFVHICSTASADNFWGGKDLSQTAKYIVDQWTDGKGEYCTTQQEDNAVAGALQRYGLFDHYLIVRAASDFDQGFAGESARDLFSTFPASDIAADNAYRVASVVAHHMIKASR